MYLERMLYVGMYEKAKLIPFADERGWFIRQ